MLYTIPDEAIEELHIICSKELGEEMSVDDARFTGNQLLNLYRCLCEIAKGSPELQAEIEAFEVPPRT
ncbi:MAG: hypothetical protein JKY49_00280 [Cohaesibacteraceae bacterium]|nr:hypothetical protein [Cohaesibacteraceae bacterium]